MRRVKQSLVELQSYRDIGIHVTDKVTCGYNWYFNHVFFFCMTVVTTIGYGHTAPVTKVGFGKLNWAVQLFLSNCTPKITIMVVSKQGTKVIIFGRQLLGHYCNLIRTLNQ